MLGLSPGSALPEQSQQLWQKSRHRGGRNRKPEEPTIGSHHRTRWARSGCPSLWSLGLEDAFGVGLESVGFGIKLGVFWTRKLSPQSPYDCKRPLVVCAMPGALFYAMMCRADLVPTEAPVRVDEEHVLRAGRLGSRPTRECSEWSVLTTPDSPHGVTVLGPQTVEQRTSSVLASLGKQLTSPPIPPSPPSPHSTGCTRTLPGSSSSDLELCIELSEKHADLFCPLHRGMVHENCGLSNYFGHPTSCSAAKRQFLATNNFGGIKALSLAAAASRRRLGAPWHARGALNKLCKPAQNGHVRSIAIESQCAEGSKNRSTNPRVGFGLGCRKITL